MIGDDELTRLALAADPATPLAPDALPLELALPAEAAVLPGWYMAPVGRRRAGRAARLVILGVVAAFLLIEAFGLCSTYGQIPVH